MAEYLSNVAKTVAIQGGLALFLTGAMSFVSAENLPDPTRPPASFSAVPTNNPVVLTSGPVLQSVLISPGRMVAIISGQTVKLGGKIGEAQVVKITESEVVLRSGKETQTLKLFPDIKKTELPVVRPPNSIADGNKGK